MEYINLSLDLSLSELIGISVSASETMKQLTLDRLTWSSHTSIIIVVMTPNLKTSASLKSDP